MVVRSGIFFILLLSLVSPYNIHAQEVTPQQNLVQESPADTTQASDSVIQRKSDVETIIEYSSYDSIELLLQDNIVKLYGNAHIKYGLIELEAARIIIDYDKQTLFAVGTKDTLGRDVNMPIFKNGQETYETKSITYNFKTGKARISEVVTKQGDGFLHGEAVFKNQDNELFSLDNTYTTCNLPDPHYRIRSRKTKAIPDDKIISGLFNLEINDVPLPLGFPFGFFPDQREAASGIIIPSYGEEKRRGFFLRGGGYFFDISDYVKMWVEGDIYSKGGHALYFNTQYSKRYSYTGNINFSYTKTRLADNVEDEDIRNDYRLRWQHSPKSKGNSRFSASINAATAQFVQNNFIGVREDQQTGTIGQLSRQLTSSVSYTKRFGNSPFSLGISGRHNQDIVNKDVSVSLPEVSFTMNNIYPFQGKTNLDILDKIQLRYTMNGTNQINNIIEVPGQSRDSVAPFNLENLPIFLENARNGVRHRIPISTSFNLLKYLSVNPSFNYEETWYFDRLEYAIDDSLQRPVVVDTIGGFNRLYEYSLSTGINTRIYGTYFFKKGKIQAIRHVLNPGISFSYSPDFSAPKYDFYQTLVNEDGIEYVESRYRRYVYGDASRGEAGNIGLSVNNTLEMKVGIENDSTGEVNVKKVSLFNNLGLSTSYNILADSFQLRPISVRANTSLFDNTLNLTVSGVIDPYVYQVNGITYGNNDEPIYDQERINRLAFLSGNGLGTLSQINLSASTNFNPKVNDVESAIVDRIQNSNLPEAEKEFALNRASSFVDFSIPWNLRVSYNLSFRKTGVEPRDITGNSLRMSGNLSLTDKWKITFNSGYDLVRKELTLTNFGIVRDLHCWTMDFNWTPFGRWQNYNFTIRVKSALLQDLKINRTRSFWDQVN